jgi:hypothetical protein
MKKTARTAAAAAVLLAAGCGTVSHQGATGGSGGRARTLAAQHLATGQGPATITRRRAEALARLMLARAPLPPGARVRPGSPPAGLGQPPSAQAGSPSAELHELWTVGEPMSAVSAFWGRNAPAAMMWNGSGQSSLHGTITQEFVGYQLSRLPAGVDAATLAMAVAPAGPDASVIRADAQVIWYPPRSAAEYIPSSVHAVTITASGLGPGQRSVTRTFTARSVVTRLAAMINGAYAQPLGSVFSCPLEEVTYRLAFATAPGAAPSLVMTDTGCPALQVTAGGHAQPPLEIPAALQPLLASLTHAKQPGVRLIPDHYVTVPRLASGPSLAG